MIVRGALHRGQRTVRAESVAGALLALRSVWRSCASRSPIRGWLNGFYCPDFPIADMHLERCGFRVYQEDARVYQELVSWFSRTHLQAVHLRGPRLSGSDFLSGRKNPTRTFYDLFEQSTDSRCMRVLDMLDRHHINVVVVNHTPGFSSRLDDQTLSALRDLYPQHPSALRIASTWIATTERFTVLWRESASSPSCASGLLQAQEDGCAGCTDTTR